MYVCMYVCTYSRGFTARVSRFTASASTRATFDLWRDSPGTLNEVANVISVHELGAPQVYAQMVHCSENHVFPLGLQPTSASQCVCAIGHEPDIGAELVCILCARGTFKAFSGNVPCALCPFEQSSTVDRGATSEQSCQCRQGFYGSSGNCYECGRGYWCEGGAERVDCPEGSSTKSTISNSFEECRCDPGWQPIQSPSVEATRNGSHRCEMCPPGFYKINSGDNVCILPCTVNAWSELGAMSPDDCFCKNGTYKVEKTQTCDSCSCDAGIHCAGGFAYNSSGNRTQDAEVQSWLLCGWPGCGWPCLGGAPFANQSLACAEGHTGPLCAACRFGWTRDTSEQACVPCSPASSVALVAAMNFDAFCKAGFALVAAMNFDAFRLRRSLL